jgi:threonine dehydrogenase-like Zn-dependent dehydrogenase
MRGAILYGPRDVRFEERDAPTIIKPTDAVIRISATCVCGSYLWPYRGISPVPEPAPMGHEYCGIVEEVGSAVTSIKPGQFVIGSFFASDNTCPHCQAGYQSSCQHKEFVGGAQAPVLRVPLADGTLVAHPGCSFGRPDPEPPVGLRRLGHRLVRRRRGQREARHDRRGRR